MNANQPFPPSGDVASGATAAVPSGTNDMMSNDKAMEHLWRYFALHAQQRVSVFNFFVVLSGVIAAAIAGALQAGRPLSIVVLGLGLILPVLSFIFSRLDRRSSDLIKISERALRAGEAACLPGYARIFVREEVAGTPTAYAGDNLLRTRWTFRKSFQFIFAFVGLAGAMASGFAAYRLFVEPAIPTQASERPAAAPTTAPGSGASRIGSTPPAVRPSLRTEQSPTNVPNGSKGSASDPKGGPVAGEATPN